MKLANLWHRVVCHFRGHVPIIRADMKHVIPTQIVKYADGLSVRVNGRTLEVGCTNCLRCGRDLWVEGVTVQAMRPMGNPKLRTDPYADRP